MDLVAPNWWNKVEQGWNKSGHIPGDALKPFLWSGRAIWVRQRAPKQGPKQEPPDPHMALKRLFLAVLDLFGGPLAHPNGPP